MKTVTISFGLENSLTKQFDAGTSLGSILRNPQVRAALDLPESGVRATVNGVEVGEDYEIYHENTRIQLHTKANTKA